MGLLESAGALGSTASKLIGGAVIPIFLIAIVGSIVLLVWAARTGKIDVPRITEYPIRAIIKRRRMGGYVWDSTERLRKFRTPIGLDAYKFQISGEIIPRSRVDSILPSVGDPIIFLEEVQTGEYYPLKENEALTEKLDKDGKPVLDKDGKPEMVEVASLAPRIVPEVAAWAAYLLRYFNEHHKTESWLERILPILVVMSVALGAVIIIYSTNQSTEPMSNALLANAKAIAEYTNVTREFIASCTGKVAGVIAAP